MRLAFDLETNGLPRQGLTQVHCLVTRDLDTGQVIRYNDQGPGRPITEGVNILAEAEMLVGHNIIAFDVMVLREIYPFFQEPETLLDTLTMSQLFFPDMLNMDLRKKPMAMPTRIYGRHSLEAWGYRLGDYKGEFGKTADWQEWSLEMEDYCEQDVHVVSTLFDKLYSLRMASPQAVTLEMKCARFMAEQEWLGWRFDVEKAQELEGILRVEMIEKADALRDIFPYVLDKEMTPKRNNRARQYFKDATFSKLKEFNPTSRDHIAWAFQTWRGWTPTEFTSTGKPKIDETVLLSIDTPEAKDLARCLELQKALGQLSEGQNAWLKQVTPQGRIHHRCVLGTNTGRNAHMRPNLGQVSSDPRCRALFLPNEGHVLVGADASGLELRMLGHYLAFYDGGRFADIAINGDIHQVNADLIGVSRKQVKTITYAFIYGAGDEKLGLSTDPLLKGKAAAELGKEVRAKFLKAIPGLETLVTAVKAKAKKGSIKGLDGRKIKVQAEHAALNYLLQSAGAICCKKWLVMAYTDLRDLYTLELEWLPLGYIHDEAQVSCRDGIQDEVMHVLTSRMPQVSNVFKLNVPLAAEAKVGQSWADTH